MTSAPCSIIYLAYGSEELQAEALYSILSYYKVAQQPAQLLIYTDSPASFNQVFGDHAGIIYPNVTPAEWQSWRGSSNKVYLLKAGVLSHAGRHYPGNLLFVDTDTIWLADPAPLFTHIENGQCIMHVSEGRLATGNQLSRKVYRHLKNHTFVVGETQYTVTKNTVLYNSGVIGLLSAATRADEVILLADQLYATYNKHMMEQLAFGMWLATTGPIREAAPYVLHYWNLKAARPQLAQLLRAYAGKSLDEFYARATALNLAQLHRAEMAYRECPSWQRTLLKLLGRHWQMPTASH
ncbi:HAD family hydrolase [Hymenobacter baengnokdamensis]|uniref:hypothetical protein n=1 Tax=Hymenobacter baengnokdamensis TaxID=2615203 RepID=UPI001243A6AC|nr:hypothetical protein [Hymenobacter baengnokdamensis]